VAAVAPPPSVPLQFGARHTAVRILRFYDTPEVAKHAAVQEITHFLTWGKVCHLADPHFPLESARQVHQAVEGGAIGKVVLDVTGGV
jgi:NADPH:quinone reductase-like Zn-dependent oxidoreductase